MSKQRGLTDEQKEKAMELRGKGLGYGAIGKELGANRDQVRDYMRTKGARKLANQMNLDLGTVSRGNVNKKASPKPPVERTCKNCLTNFYKEDTNINSTMYCSDKCRKGLRNQKRREGRSIKKALCSNCNKVFVRKGSQTYCSDECRYENKTCVSCSETFKVWRGVEQLTCSASCGGKLTQRTHEQYYKDFSDIHKGAIVPLTMYEGVDSDMTVWCVSCQEKTTAIARAFIRNVRAKGCEHCGHVSSEGERTIERWLDDNEVEYRAEQSFEDLVDTYPLRYDFAILNEDETIRCLVEYDGIQHFEPVEAFGGIPFFKDQQKKDKMKNEYAKANGIKLYRISYKQRKNINKILEGMLA